MSSWWGVWCYVLHLKSNFLCLAEKQEEQLKNNSRDLTMVSCCMHAANTTTKQCVCVVLASVLGVYS